MLRSSSRPKHPFRPARNAPRFPIHRAGVTWVFGFAAKTGPPRVFSKEAACHLLQHPPLCSIPGCASSGHLKRKINRQSFDTWLKPTRFSYVKERMLFVRIPTPEFQHIGERYTDLIQEAIDALHLEFDDVTFITPEEDPTLARVREDGGFAPVPTHAPNAPANGARAQVRGLRSPSGLHSRPGLTGRRRRSSTRATLSTHSSSDRETSSRAPRPKPWLSAHRRLITRSFSTAAPAWARPTSCTPSDTR